MSSFDFLKLTTNMTRFALDSQTVIALRMMGMAGVTPQSPDENSRMVAEKGPALMQSYIDASQAALAGKRPDQVMEAALEPLQQEVRANRNRLMG